jgi:hypothetical protein
MLGVPQAKVGASKPILASESLTYYVMRHLGFQKLAEGILSMKLTRLVMGLVLAAALALGSSAWAITTGPGPDGTTILSGCSPNGFVQVFAQAPVAGATVDGTFYNLTESATVPFSLAVTTYDALHHDYNGSALTGCKTPGDMMEVVVPPDYSMTCACGVVH